MDKQSSDDKKNDNLNRMLKQAELAFQEFQVEEYEKASLAYDHAIQLAHQFDEFSHKAVFLTYKALCDFECGKIDQALKLGKEAVHLAIEEKNVSVLLNAKLVLAEIFRDCGNTEAAINAFLDSFDLSSKLEEYESQELALSNLGRLYLDLGRPEQAAQCFRHLLESVEGIETKAQTMGSLGLCMAEMGKFEEAINNFRTAYLEAELCDDLTSMAVCSGSEGNVLFELESYDRALACYEKALSLSTNAEDKARMGAWQGNIGSTLIKLNRLDEAMQSLEIALETARLTFDKHSQAAHLDSLGDCYQERGELDLAKEKYEEALQLSKSMDDRLAQRIYLANLGRVYQRMGQLQPAFDYLGQAVDIFNEQRATICSDDLKTSFANRGRTLYKDVIDVCISMGKRTEALEFIGKAKSRALLDLLSNSPIDISTLADDGDQSLKKLIEREKELRLQIDHLERVIWQGSSPGSQDSSTRGATTSGEETKQVYTEWRNVVNQLKGSHPNYASLVSAQTLSFEEIQSLWKGEDRVLDDNTCILEFFLTEEYIMAMGIHSELDEPIVEILDDLEKQEMLNIDIETFLEMSATEGWDVPKSLCKRIYEGLVGGLLEKLPAHIDRLVIVPHGNLFHVPFAALHDGERYLCEKYTLSYLPSVTLITVLANSQNQAGIENPDKYLVSAISDYSATRENGLVLSSTLRSSAGLDDLTYTLEEADSIVNLEGKKVSEAKLITNDEVKDVFPNLFGEYPVVHFAGHAVFNNVEPMASGLVLSDGTILTAASILERRSLKTNCGHLLVLSACQTGVNKVTQGGEVLGMARALIYAGMPNLILTLWEVADRSTSDLMKSFHDSWQSEKKSIAKALQDVQIQAIKDGMPIHAWAPFIHFGIM